MLKQKYETTENVIAFYSNSSSNADSVSPSLNVTFTLPEPSDFSDDAAVEPLIEPDTPITGPLVNDASKLDEDVSVDPAIPTAERGLNHNRNLKATTRRDIQPPGGDGGQIKSHGYSYAKVPFVESSATFVNNKAEVWWFGGNPFYASEIRMTETWVVSGAAISLATDAVAVEGTEKTAEDVTTVTNEWRVKSYWDTVRFTGIIYRVRHTVTGKFCFGSTCYGVTATDSSIV